MPAGARHIACQPASSSAGACRTGSPRSAAAASAAKPCSSSPTPRTRRAHDRAARGVRDLRRADRSRRRRARRRGAGRGRAPVARLPAARRGAAALRRSRRLRGGAPAPRAAPQSAASTFLSDLRDLKVGDLVVHVDHGIGVFVGLKRIDVGRRRRSSWSSATRATTSCSCRSSGSTWSRATPARPRRRLDRLGGTTWEKAKTRVKKAMRDMAEELLKLYAARKAVPGHAFSPDTHWQQEFEDAFAYDLTVDQKTAIADIKSDMEAPTPMDRLLCGDVGYGKTEVAMRAAFKAVMDGKQVAVLAPTTVLAFQHVKTLRERFAGFPVAHRHGEPLPHQGGAEGDARRPRRRQGRHHRRHAPAAVEGRRSSATSACSSSTRSSASASRTRSGSSRCASASTC